MKSKEINNRINDRRSYNNSNISWLDSVGFGVFLLIIAFIFLRYPWFIDEFIIWIKNWSIFGPYMAPITLIPPIYNFFILIGIWNILKGLLKIFLGVKILKSFKDIIEGGFDLGIALILRTYYLGKITAPNILSAFLILLGLTIILTGFVSIINEK